MPDVVRQLADINHRLDTILLFLVISVLAILTYLFGKEWGR